MRIRKVKWSPKDSVLFLEWEKQSAGDALEWDKFSAEYKDEPAPRFFKARKLLERMSALIVKQMDVSHMTAKQILEARS